MLRLVLLWTLLLTACAVSDTPPPEVLPLTATNAPRPTDTPTPIAELESPPELRHPDHQTLVNLEVEAIRLAWIYTRPVERGEVFEVRVGREGGVLEHVTYSQSNGVDVTEWFRLQEPGWFHWTVRVMKRRQQPGVYQQISYSADAFSIEVIRAP